jgi:HSP20 family protein
MADITVRDPMSLFERRFGDMDRLLDRLGARAFWRNPELFADGDVLALDVREEDGQVVVETSLPGFQKDEIEVELGDGVLSIRGERKHEEERKEASYYFRERSQGAVARRVEIPGITAGAEVDASLKNGVLTLKIPMAEESKPKRVEISEG